METSSEIIQQLTSHWASIHNEVLGLLPTIQPTERVLMDIVVANQPLVECWAQKATSDEPSSALARVRSAVIELLLWSLLKTCESAEQRKELLGALWLTLESIIRGRAEAMARNLPSLSRRIDEVEQYMQEAYFQFAEALDRYDPSRKQTMVRTFVRTFYRSRMINIAKSKAMKSNECESLAEPADSVDDSEAESRFDQEQIEDVENALKQIARDDERDAERVIAFRKFMIEGMENADVARDMGRSTSWVTKAHQRIREMLREKLLK